MLIAVLQTLVCGGKQLKKKVRKGEEPNSKKKERKGCRHIDMHMHIRVTIGPE